MANLIKEYRTLLREEVQDVVENILQGPSYRKMIREEVQNVLLQNTDNNTTTKKRKREYSQKSENIKKIILPTINEPKQKKQKTLKKHKGPHQIPPDEERCQASKTNGDQCKQRKKDGKQYCTNHQKLLDKDPSLLDKWDRERNPSEYSQKTRQIKKKSEKKDKKEDKKEEEKYSLDLDAFVESDVELDIEEKEEEKDMVTSDKNAVDSDDEDYNPDDVDDEDSDEEMEDIEEDIEDTPDIETFDKKQLGHLYVVKDRRLGNLTEKYKLWFKNEQEDEEDKDEVLGSLYQEDDNNMFCLFGTCEVRLIDDNTCLIKKDTIKSKQEKAKKLIYDLFVNPSLS